MEKNLFVSEKKESTQAILTALVSNLIISILKFLGYFLSLSPSMLAEALHSIADTVNQFLLFLGIRYTTIVPSKTHPWGTGIRQYLFNLFSAIGVFVVGGVITIGHAIHELSEPDRSIDSKSVWIALGILVISLIIEGYSFLKALEATLNKMRREGKNFLDFIKTSDDSSLTAVLLEDAVAVVGVIIALIGLGLSQIFKTNLPDIISAFVIGSMLSLISLFLFKNNLSFILGKSTDLEKEAEIRDFIESMKSVDKVVDLKTEILGPNRVYLAVEINLDNSALVDAEQIRKDSRIVKKQESRLYETLVDTWMRGARSVARELNRIDMEVKKKFPEIENTHFEVSGGEHIWQLELLEVVNHEGLSQYNHIDMVKISGKISADKILKVLIDLSLIKEDEIYTVKFEKDTYNVFKKKKLLFQLRG